MWKETFHLAMAVELGLVGCKMLFHPDWLPLGGGHVEQIAILFILGFVLMEVVEFCRRLRGSSK